MKVKKIWQIAALLGALALMFGAATWAQESWSQLVYVESDGPNHNKVLAYRNEGGNLRWVGEYATGGKGLLDLSLALGPFDSDQDVYTNREGTVLYAVNPGSDTVAAFRIGRDGSLTHLAGSPFASGGTQPASVGIARGNLVVVNKAMDARRPDLNQPNYATFSLGADGAPGARVSNVDAPIGSSPSQADISPLQRLVFDTQWLGGHLQSFLIDRDGVLKPEDFQALPEAPFAGMDVPHGALGLWTHPLLPVLYVGFTTINKLGVYTFGPFGKLNFVRTVADSGMAICWIRSNAFGTRLYVSNTGDGSISVYDSTAPLQPKEIQHLVLGGVGSPFQIELDRNEKYLYVVTQRATPDLPLGEGSTLHALRVDPASGKLVSDSFVKLPVPAEARPQGLATVDRF